MSLRVERLFIHPIKSCASVEVSEFVIGEAGPQVALGSASNSQFIGDREWMFVDEEGKFLTQRSLTRMALLKPRLDFGSSRFFLQVENQEFEIPLRGDFSRRTVSIWGKEVNAACIDGPLNKAVSEFLKISVQLVRFDQHSDREVLLKGNSLGVQTRFTDTQPYLIVTEESLRDLNAKMSTPIGIERFRPNVVLKGSALPFEEDHWQFVGHESIVFESTKACGRCKVITVDPLTGLVVSPEPLVALSRFRKKDSSVLFGQYFLSRSFGETLKKGTQLQSQTA